jgi:hypothetical protein
LSLQVLGSPSMSLVAVFQLLNQLLVLQLK